MIPMLMRNTIIIFIITISYISNAQINEKQVRLAGLISVGDSVSTPPYVHIVNICTGAGVISDSLGLFKITMQKKDSLLFRCIGYDDKIFKFSDTIQSTTIFVKIDLSQTTYYIDVIDVYALNRISQFKYDFLQIPIPEGKVYELYIEGISQKKKYKWMLPEPSIIPSSGGMSLISALYYMWSDKGKSIVEYIRLVEEEDGNIKIDRKFNIALLSDFTGFTGDTLIDFRIFLDFNRSYLLKTSGYDIFKKVKEKLPEFEAEYLE